jgi:RNA polymerase sigma factor (sigma-70 family)
VETSELEASFRRLFLAEYRYVLAYALRRTPDPADAHDAVAETFTVAWRRMGDAPATEEARPWLYGIARKAIANQRRSGKRFGALRERLAAEPPPASADVPGEGRNEWQQTLAALSRLPDADREVLRLAVWEELSHREIAAVIGCSENAAALRLHRARKRLAEVISEKEDRASGHSAIASVPLIETEEER